MIQLSVAIVVVGSVLGTLGVSGATTLPGEAEEPTKSIPTSAGVVPREFKFKVESAGEEIDPVAHAEKLRYEVDRLELRDRLPDPLPATFPAQYESGSHGSAEDLIYYLPPEPPNLWADIDMPVEPRSDFLVMSLLGLGVWAIYWGWKREVAES